LGKIFTKAGEFTHLALGIKNAKKLKIKESETLQEAIKKISELLDIDVSKEAKTKDKDTVKDALLEIHLDKIIRELPEPKNDNVFKVYSENKKFSPISPYPFAVRDIAVFVPEGVSEKDLNELIEKESGKLLVRKTLFDVFRKEMDRGAKTSYAFRLVFQSHEKTLTEEEINSIMKNITDRMNENSGWQVR
jgi:hypothetical protein